MHYSDCESYNCLDDLRNFGIICLTGEACGLAMRTLFDLTEDGKKIVEEFFRASVKTESNWNQGDKNNPHVASIMLPASVCQDLWIFAHVRQGTRYVFLGEYVNNSQWTEERLESINETVRYPDKTWHPRAFAINDEGYMERFRKYEGTIFHISRWFKKSKAPGTGLDNEHQMSGRTV